MKKNNIKEIAAAAAGIGAFVCSLISASDIFFPEHIAGASSVKKRGRGYSAVYIRSNKSKSIYSAASAFLLAVAGAVCAVLFYESKSKLSERK